MEDSSSHIIHKDSIQSSMRGKFTHKGDYGHSLLVCGSRGMMGAAMLSVGGALRSGCGLVTACLEEEYFSILNITHPSAMAISELGDNLEKYSAIGIGCGLGKKPKSVELLRKVLSLSKKAMVIDADALNIISENRNMINMIPKNSIITPHEGELRRLIGEWNNENEKEILVKKISTDFNIYVVVKGAYTTVFAPSGGKYINTTGNPGMAKGGSGDILTGFITGLLAKGVSSLDAAVTGVFFHGIAGDLAREIYGEESMNSLDILKSLKIL